MLIEHYGFQTLGLETETCIFQEKVSENKGNETEIKVPSLCIRRLGFHVML